LPPFSGGFGQALERLEAMGFYDTAQNIEFLEKFHGDLKKAELKLWTIY
jgi:hypothetical protein